MKGDLQQPLCREVHYGLEIAVIEGYYPAENAIRILERCEQR